MFAKLFWDIYRMPKDWARLASAVAHRRKELGLSQDAIRQAGGPSDIVVGRIENNETPHPRDDTINKLDQPLRWQPGSAQRVLAGGSPTEFEQTLDLREVPIDSLLGEIRRRVVSVGGARHDPQPYLAPQWRRPDPPEEWFEERLPRPSQG